ncbi:MAG TPA: protein kinase [Acidobacteriota bacterium]|nr:protein kinase [Acidobacteriota bacterium]
MSLEIGSEVGPYKILDTVGAGGMGEVYRARDTRLHRDVAIKVLPQRHVDNEEAKARFEREARAVAALSHPNIVSIFDFGFIGESPYAVSELLEGESLRSRLSSGRLSWQQAAEVGVALAEGLAAAHSKGIIHRDLKPENIFLTEDDRVKILDFGLASVEGVQQFGPHSSAPTAITKTEPGTVLGTVGYMSPEQVRGMPTDERSDIFSLGAILFEMITGQRAFQGDTSSDIMAAILRDEAGSAADSGVSIPLQLETAVRECLKKNPDQRPQSAREVRAELKAALGAAETAAFTPMPTADSSASSSQAADSRFSSARVVLFGLAAVALLAVLGLIYLNTSGAPDPTAPVRSLAILPFHFEELPGEEATADASHQLEYLSKEVVESLINRLSDVEELQVMAWSTVQEYEGEADDPLAAGRELGVDAVLTGRVSKGEDTITVQATLLDTRHGFQIWGDRFQEPFAESDDFQEQVALKVVERLGYSLPASGDTLETAFRPDPEAYSFYLEARHKQGEKRMAERDAVEIEEQLEAYQKALDIDSDFLKAQQGLAELLSKAGAAGHLDPEVAMPMAKEAASRLIELERGSVETHNVLATVYSRFERDWDKVEEELSTALEMNPRSAETLQHYAMDYMVPTGQLEEAEAALQKALKLTPKSAPLLLDLGRVHYYQRRYDSALESFRQANNQGLPDLSAEQYAALSLIASGRPERAVRMLEKQLEGSGPEAEAFNPARSQALAVLGLAYGRSGRTQQAERVLTSLRSQRTHMRRMFVAPGGRSRRPQPPDQDRERDSAMVRPPRPSAPVAPPPPGQTSGIGVAGVQAGNPFPGLAIGEWGSRPYWMALVHLGMGQDEEAMQLLARAVRARASEAVYLNVDPILDPLHRRRDFQQLIEELRLDD